MNDAIAHRLQRQVLLRSYFTSHTGGTADYFFEAHTLNDLVAALNYAVSTDLAYVVVGQGGNVLFSDYGFDGLVIVNRCQNILFLNNSQILVDSGINLDLLATGCADRSLSSLEFLVGQQGSLGGALYFNSEYRGQKITSLLKQINIYHATGSERIAQHSLKWLISEGKASKLRRSSEIKHPPVLLNVKLQLSQARADSIIQRMRQYVTNSPKNVVRANLRTVFVSPYGYQIKDLIQGIGIDRLRRSPCRMVGTDLNDLVISSEVTSSFVVRDFLDEIKSRVISRYGLKLEDNLVYIGNWEEERIDRQETI